MWAQKAGGKVQRGGVIPAMTDLQWMGWLGVGEVYLARSAGFRTLGIVCI